MKNRLNLDWKLEWSDERSAFLTDYLKVIPFTPTEEELDTMSKYILWGKNRQTGLNGRQEGLELETRAGTWDTKEVESLEALLETPSFNETSILGLNNAPPRIPKETFSRSNARQNAPSHILPTLESLWRQIDELELLLSFYDLSHGRRTAPIRQALLDRFSPSQLSSIKDSSTHLSIYTYLQKRHSLIELRRQQYTLKDFYSPTLSFHLEPSLQTSNTPSFGVEINVRPFGICNGNILDQKIFNLERFPEPKDFTPEEITQISKKIWAPASSTQFTFDFQEVKHLYALYGNWQELNELAQDLEDQVSENSMIRELLRAAASYQNLARLDPIHRDILDLKIQKKTNIQIADFINQTYKKNYKPNYISTLYCQKCLDGIAKAAAAHYEVMKNIMFEENFKKCKDCGAVLLLNEENFVRRHRSNDGFSPRCKRCEKILREKKASK